MSGNQMMMFEEEQRQIQASCDLLSKNAQALAVLVIDKNGQEIARSGETDNLDVTSLSSLFAGNVAATGGIAKLLAEKEFSGQFHEGEKTNVHISLVAQRAILVVLFDQRSSLGLVRLRVKKAGEELTNIFNAVIKKMNEGGAKTQVFGEITDDDIDNLFSD
jgi:predicted regulator of Ras-like GTPase activity (Roadblock/LC7/MglB family)